MDDVSPLPVDIRWLESFSVLAKELHFTRAAVRLGVSQPAISQQIARLERQLGTPLFVRGSGVVRLTAAGEALALEVGPAMARLQAGIVAARAVAGGEGGRLRVRHLSSYGPLVLPMVAARLREDAPGLTVELREASIEEQVAALRDRSADVGVFHLDIDVEPDVPGVVLTALTNAAPRFVALPLGHVLAEHDELPLDRFAGDVWIMPVGSTEHSLQEQNFVATCRRHGFTPRVSQRANSIETMLGLVASGFGVAPAPWSVALRPPSSVRLVRVVDDQHRVVVAHRADDVSLPALARFVGAARPVVEGLLAELRH